MESSTNEFTLSTVTPTLSIVKPVFSAKVLRVTLFSEIKAFRLLDVASKFEAVFFIFFLKPLSLIISFRLTSKVSKPSEALLKLPINVFTSSVISTTLVAIEDMSKATLPVNGNE